MSNMAILLALVTILIKVTNGQVPLGQLSLSADNLTVEDQMTSRVGADLHFTLQAMVLNNADNVTITTVLPTNINKSQVIPLRSIGHERDSNGSMDSYTFRLSNFIENRNYTLFLELDIINQQPMLIISNPFPLLTTSVQRLTVESIESNRATVSCHFLPGTSADGCLVQWKQITNLGGETVNRSEILMTRIALANLVSVEIERLLPETRYMVETFSIREGERLHDFGIPLEGDLVTTTQLTSLKGSYLAPVAVSITISILLALVIIIIIIVFIAAMRVRKVTHMKLVLSRQMHRESTATETTLRYSGRASPENLSSFELENDKDFALEKNVCYDSQHKPATKKTTMQDTSDTESLHIYDDVKGVESHVETQIDTSSNGLATPSIHVTNRKHWEVKSHAVRSEASGVPAIVVSTRPGCKSKPHSHPVTVLNIQPSHFVNSEDIDAYVDTTPPSPSYENVDPASGSPVPLRGHSLVISDWTCDGTSSERAALPFAGSRVGSPAPAHLVQLDQPKDYEIPISTMLRKQRRT